MRIKIRKSGCFQYSGQKQTSAFCFICGQRGFNVVHDPTPENSGSTAIGGSESLPIQPGTSSDGTSTAGDEGGVTLPPNNDADIEGCSRLLGVGAYKIMVAGNQNQVTLAPDTVIALKVAGNKNAVVLTIDGPEGTEIAGLCIFMRGNQSDVFLDLSVGMGILYYSGRANLTTGTVQVGSSGTIKNIVTDLSGNQAKLAIQGPGSYNCGNAIVRERKQRTIRVRKLEALFNKSFHHRPS